MIFNPLSVPTFDLAHVNRSVLLKDLCYYTGIYFSSNLTESILNENPRIPYYRDADSYNLPFIVCIAAKKINLEYQKVANPRLIQAINSKSNNFHISTENNQILPIEDKNTASIFMYFDNQKVERANLLSLKISVVESCDGVQNNLYSFHIFAKMFNHLILRKDE